MTLREFGLRFAAQNGIRPLRRGETRPVGFYLVDHYTGRPLIADRNAVVRTDLRDVDAGADPALVDRDH
jgi:hypothetical protein